MIRNAFTGEPKPAPTPSNRAHDKAGSTSDTAALPGGAEGAAPAITRDAASAVAQTPHPGQARATLR